MTQISIVKCGNYDTEAVQKAVNEAVGLLGGIEKFVRPGQKVLIKPNILSGRPPKDGVCTHPEVVRALIRLLRQATNDICVGDSPGGFDVVDLDEIYRVSGFAEMCGRENVRLVHFDSAVNVDGIPLARIAREADVIINVPKMKTHGLTILTGAVKNMFGAVVGKYKAECHFKHAKREEFCRRLVEIFSYVKPSLNVMDGILIMDGDGPAAGRLRNAGLILAGPDAVSVDAVFAQLAGVEPEKMLTTVYAGKAELGMSDISDIAILGERVDDVRFKDFLLPGPAFMYNLPDKTARLIGSLVRSYPFVGRAACVSCRICEKSCPAGAINIDKYHIDYSKCIFCFCCHELCPHNAIGIKKSFTGRLFNLAVKVRNVCLSALSGGKKAR